MNAGSGLLRLRAGLAQKIRTPGGIGTSLSLPLLGALAGLVLGFDSGRALASGNSTSRESLECADGAARAKSGDADPAAREMLASDIELRIESLVEHFFAVLGNPEHDAATLDPLLADGPFELALDGALLSDRPALREWVSNLRANFPHLEFRIDSIRVDKQVQGRYRVRFAFDRHALDASGLPHVARRVHSWIVASEPDSAPLILRIEEQPMLFFPGTGPQIVCY